MEPENPKAEPTKRPVSIELKRTSKRPKADNQSILDVLGKLLTLFRSKDTAGLFHEPVDTNVVTDYFSVIKHPMDFSTMAKRLDPDSGQCYHTFQEFQDDFELICLNAMTYNAPNTIYYRQAHRLLGFGRKYIAKELERWGEGEVLAESEEHPNALFRRCIDGSVVFSSLKKYQDLVSISVNNDGSLDGAMYSDVVEMFVNKHQPSIQNTHLESHSTIGASSTILAGHISKSLKPFSSPVQGSSVYDCRGPFFSFSPCYDSQGYPVASFEYSGLALAYGDPKGRAYIESLERFLDNGGSSWTRDYCRQLVDSQSCGGHLYLKEVDRWKRNMANKKTLNQTSESLDPVSEQVRADLNHLARLLRWKKMEPEVDKQLRCPAEQVIKQFAESSDLPIEPIENRDGLDLQQTCSMMLLSLQHLQDERFRSGRSLEISDEERDLVHKLRVVLGQLSGSVVPNVLSNGSEIDKAMETLAGPDRICAAFQGTLPLDKCHAGVLDASLKMQGLEEPLAPWSGESESL